MDIQGKRISFGVAAFQQSADWETGNAQPTLTQAWESGIRLFDTSALYGGGLTEIGLGKFLEAQGGDKSRVTTKCGRYRELGAPPPRDGGTSDWRDYSRDATLFSVERSLKRLEAATIETVFIHDPDDYMTEALDGAYPALRAFKDSKAIGGVGIATNSVETAYKMLAKAPFDAVMLANSHSVIDPDAAAGLLAKARETHTDIFISGVFLSGILATGSRRDAKYKYGSAPQDILQKVAAIEETGARYGTGIRNITLNYLARDPLVDVITLGASRAEQLQSSLDDLRNPPPYALWRALGYEGCDPHD